MYLTFDDNQTPLIATDSSINGNDGVISSGADYVFESGDGSVSSLLLDGSGSVNLGPLDVEADGSGLTLAAWVKANSFPGTNRDPRIISKTRNISNNSHVFSLNTTRRGSSGDTVLQGRVKVRGGTAVFRASTGFLETGVWYHTCLLYTSPSARDS